MPVGRIDAVEAELPALDFALTRHLEAGVEQPEHRATRKSKVDALGKDEPRTIVRDPSRALGDQGRAVVREHDGLRAEQFGESHPYRRHRRQSSGQEAQRDLGRAQSGAIDDVANPLHSCPQEPVCHLLHLIHIKLVLERTRLPAKEVALVDDHTVPTREVDLGPFDAVEQRDPCVVVELCDVVLARCLEV